MKTIFSIIACVMLCVGVRAGTIDSAGYDTNTFVVSKTAGTVTLNTNVNNPKAAATKGDLTYALSLSNQVYQAQIAAATNNLKSIIVGGLSAGANISAVTPGARSDGTINYIIDGINNTQFKQMYSDNVPDMALESDFEALTNSLGSSAFLSASSFVTGQAPSVADKFPKYIGTGGTTLTNSGFGPADFDAAGAATAVTNASPFLLYQMSPPGGNNEYADMRSASNRYNGRVLGVSYPGVASSGAWLWTASGRGLGTNVWGGPLNFPGGVHTFGNRYWEDLPQSVLNDPESGEEHYIGYGPFNSSSNAAYPNIGLGPQQPVYNFIYGNPYCGADFLLVRGAFTNSAHGFFAGNDSNGVPVYISQFGLAIGQVSDAYNPLENGVPTQRASDSQQAPSFQLGLMSDLNMDAYLSYNFQRSGDAVVGQAPVFAVNPRGWGTGGGLHIGMPKVVPNVWMTKQPGWLWSLEVEEQSGDVRATNGTFYADRIQCNGTNKGDYVFGRAWDIAAPVAINTSAEVSFPLNPNNYVGAFTVDGQGAHRIGIVLQFGGTPHLAHASGVPFIISQYGTSDLQSSFTQATTSTNEITIWPDSTVTIWKTATNNSDLYVNGVIHGDGSGLTNLSDTNVVVSTNNWNWPGPTNSLDWARGTLQRYRPAATTPLSITNFVNFPVGQVAPVVLWIENTNTSALNVKLPSPCEATNSLGGLTVSVNASNRLQILVEVTPLSTNALFSDQQLIK